MSTISNLVVEGDTRRLYVRLHDEKDNPPALRQNLDNVVDRVREHLMDTWNTTTTYDSVVTCLLYMARDGKVNDPMRQAIYDIVQEYR